MMLLNALPRENIIIQIYKKKATTKILFILVKKTKAILNLVLQWNCYDSSAYIQKTQNKSEAVKV